MKVLSRAVIKKRGKVKDSHNISRCYECIYTGREALIVELNNK